MCRRRKGGRCTKGTAGNAALTLFTACIYYPATLT